MRPLVIAVDFDGTMCEHKYPAIGKPKDNVIKWLRNHKINGNRLILWTCRSGKHLRDAVIWSREHGIEFDSVNDDLEYIKDSQFGREKSCKVCADMYIDDRNVILEKLI